MVDVAALSVSINADTTGLESGIARAKSEVGGLGSTIQTALGAAAVGAVVGLGAAFVGSVKSAADFEKQISAISAVAGASASEMEGLRAAALQLGKDTSFSASEAATGIEELIKAGVEIGDVLGGAARASLDLAAAGAISVGEAAEIAANAMNVFGIEGDKMAHVADVIAGAANASAIGVNDYKFSLAAAGAVAATVGISFESLSQAIAVMGNAGIKGSDAGTSLKTMMMNLIPTTAKQKDLFRDLGLLTFDVQRGLEGAAKAGIQPMTQDLAGLSAAMMEHLGLSRDVAKWSKNDRTAYEELSTAIGLTKNEFFDATGKAKDFGAIAEALKTALAGMTKEQQLATLEVMFGSDAIRAAAVLAKEGAAGFDEMAEAMSKVTAQSVANERLNNLWGSVDKLTGSLETGAIILGGMFTPALKEMADALTGQVNAGIEILEQIPDAIETIKQVMAGDWSPDASIHPFTNAVGEAALMLKDRFGPAIKVVSDFITGTLMPAFKSIAAPIGAAVAAFVGVIGVSGLVSAAVAGIVAVLGLLISPLGAVALAAAALAAAWTTNFGGIQQKVAEFVEIVQRALTGDIQGAFTQLIALLSATALEISGQLLIWGQAFVTWVAPMIPPMLAALAALGLQLVTWVATQIPVITAQLLLWGQEFVAWVEPQIPPLMAALGTLLAALTVWALTVALPAIVAELAKWGQEFITWVGLADAGMMEGLGRLLANLIAWQITVTAEIAKGVIAWATELGKTGPTAIPEMLAGLATFGVAIETWMLTLGPRMLLWGVDAIKAFIEGFLSVSIPMPSFGGGGGGGGEGQPPGRGGATSSETGSASPLRNTESYVATPLSLGRTGVPQVNQMRMGLSVNEAKAACGPAALAWFMNMTGRTPTGAEAKQLAQQGGWDSGRGMYGPGAFSSALTQAGIPNQVSYSPSDAEIDRLARSGTPFAISTGEHYYQVGGGSTAGLNVGASGTVLGGGSEVMSLEEIRRRGYPIQATVVPNIPPPAPPAPVESGPRNFERLPLGGGPGGDPSQWPGFMHQVVEAAPDYLATLQLVNRDGIMVFESVAAAGTTAGANLVSASTDSLGNVTRIYTENGAVIGATITDTAGQIVNTWGTMGAAVVASTATTNLAVGEANTALGTRLIEETTIAAGITVAKYQEQSGAIVTIVTGQNGQILADYTLAAEQIGLVTDLLHTTYLTSTTDALGMTTEIWREKTGEITTIVTDASGKVVEEFTSVGKAAIATEQPLQQYGTNIENIPQLNLKSSVSELNAMARAADKATQAIIDLVEASEDLPGSGGGSSSSKSKGADRRAVGGPVIGGQMYMVGEQGPEMFYAPTSGNIIPNHRLGGGGDTTIVNVTVNVPGILTHQDDLEQVIGNAVVDYLRHGAPLGSR